MVKGGTSPRLNSGEGEAGREYVGREGTRNQRGHWASREHGLTHAVISVNKTGAPVLTIEINSHLKAVYLHCDCLFDDFLFFSLACLENYQDLYFLSMN